ncbi:MAG: phosphoglucosamine mutase [Alphaproteobacteria bacterium]|nr:phosphoglucosamine mutase [Alphaproteobacteria bacterium]
MARSLFGTDGIRGTANREPMTAETALAVGMAAGAQFLRGAHRHRVVIGKDTRLSGYLLEPALTAGFIAVGMDVVLLGPLPTPAVAMLTRSLRADLGVMISASHNPYEDNGIKLFGPDGFKLSDQAEAEIEARMARGGVADRAAPGVLGRASRLDDAVGRYIEFVKRTLPNQLTLDGLKVVIDCANGAAYRVAPTVLHELGAEVIEVGTNPDGFNINAGCGSTDLTLLFRSVQEHGAHLGIALDGDADRVVMCDEKSNPIDGDQIIALIASAWHRANLLKGGAVVGTVMSNLGLERFVESLGLSLVRTPVGDRYVVEEMRRRGCNLGGEQSGHVILGDVSTTGDGLIAALQAMAVMVSEGFKASALSRVFAPLPQVKRNIQVEHGDPLAAAAVRRAIADGEAELGARGRLIIRKSGTEPVVRIMAEGDDPALIGTIADAIERAVRDAARALAQ